MGKRKREHEPEDLMEAQQQQTIDTAQTSVEISDSVPDKMAAARETKKNRPAGENGHKPKGADIVYVIVGTKVGTQTKSIIGVKRTRGQCRKQWDNLKEMASALFDDIHIVKGKRIEVNSL